MPEEYKEYNDLIKQMKTMPQVNPPSDITQQVMGRLVDDHHSSIRQLFSRTIKQAGEISLSGFVRADSTMRDACFSFFVTGLFFFLIGSILFCSVLFMGYESGGKAGLILIPSILILMASISLFIGGLIVAADSQTSAYWAKRAIMVYGALMILNVVFVASVVQTVFGGMLVLTCGVAVIVMGITLLKTLENSLQGSSATYRGELNNV